MFFKYLPIARIALLTFPVIISVAMKYLLALAALALVFLSSGAVAGTAKSAPCGLWLSSSPENGGTTASGVVSCYFPPWIQAFPNHGWRFAMWKVISGECYVAGEYSQYSHVVFTAPSLCRVEARFVRNNIAELD